MFAFQNQQKLAICNHLQGQGQATRVISQQYTAIIIVRQKSTLINLQFSTTAAAEVSINQSTLYYTGDCTEQHRGPHAEA